MYLRFFTTVAHGGCGISDPMVDRLSAYPASFLSTLPLLLQVPLHRQRILDTPSWNRSDSLILREAAVTLANVCEGPSNAPSRKIACGQTTR